MSIPRILGVLECDEKDSGKWKMLLALANFENDKDGLCNPGLEKLAAMARMTPRNGQRMLDELEMDGKIEVIRSRPNKYVINIAKKYPSNRTLCPVSVENKPDISTAVNRTFATPEQDISGTQTGHLRQRNKEEPVLTGKESGKEALDISRDVSAIAQLHPRLEKPEQTEKDIRRQVQLLIEKKNITPISAIDYLERRTNAYRQKTSGWPTEQRPFIVSSATWFRSRCYEEDDQRWERRKGATSIGAYQGNGQVR